MKKIDKSEFFLRVNRLDTLLFVMLLVICNCIPFKESIFDPNSALSQLLKLISLLNAQRTIATPTFSPTAGYYDTAQSVTISTTTSGANVYYTTDGTTPTTSSTVYSNSLGHIWFVAGKTIKAFATKSGLIDSSVLSGTFSYAPLKSGQMTCYDPSGTTGNVAVCSTTKQDGESQTGATRGYTGPTVHATYTSDYTTTDTATGLVWKSCSQGLSGATCGTGTAATLTWADASADVTNGCSALNSVNSGNGYAGIKTWRLPTRLELETLPDYNTSNPSINTTAFPSTFAAAYWSSTTYALDTTVAWNVIFLNGNLNNDIKTNTYYVRCVAGSSKDLILSYTDNGGGTVTDNTTGLIWQMCFQGRNNDATCSDDGGVSDISTWANAITYCSGLSLANKTWRMPNINELKTIVDTAKASGAKIDTTAFPSTDASNYWSSTSNSQNPTNAWGVGFSGGGVTLNLKTSSYYVRCVSLP